jgi:hypothetical protein
MIQLTGWHCTCVFRLCWKSYRSRLFFSPVLWRIFLLLSFLVISFVVTVASCFLCTQLSSLCCGYQLHEVQCNKLSVNWKDTVNSLQIVLLFFFGLYYVLRFPFRLFCYPSVSQQLFSFSVLYAYVRATRMLFCCLHLQLNRKQRHWLTSMILH